MRTISARGEALPFGISVTFARCRFFFHHFSPANVSRCISEIYIRGAEPRSLAVVSKSPERKLESKFRFISSDLYFSFGSTENQTDSILFYFLILGKFKRLEKIRRPTRFIGLVKFLGLLFYSVVKLNSDGIRSSIIISRLTR